MNKKSNIGLIGLAVMGENLALNMERNGFQVSVYNRAEGAEAHVVEHFMSGRGAGKNFVGFTELRDFVESLERPRKIMMMIRAGRPVDLVIEALLPFLSEGDVIIDGGNSNWQDSERREAELRQRGVYFVGCGISGGEEGALNGPAIMPGGAKEAWPLIEPIFTRIAAKAEDGMPCCAWIGAGGSGHFVKMVHNGIEYGDMQLIAEAYGVLCTVAGKTNDEMAEIFASWNEGKLSSYLIEITAEILRHREPDGSYLIDKILDAAGQKGTGKWSVINSLEYGQPLNLIATAVYERSLSAAVELRQEASSVYLRSHSPYSAASTPLRLSPMPKALLYFRRLPRRTNGLWISPPSHVSGATGVSSARPSSVISLRPMKHSLTSSTSYWHHSSSTRLRTPRLIGLAR